MNLVKFSFAIEERILGYHFEEDTSITPDVHLGVIVSISHEAFGRAIPAGGDVFSVGLFGVYSLMKNEVPLHEPKSANFIESPEMSTFSGLISR